MLKEITEESKRTLTLYLQWVLNGLISVVALGLWAIFSYGVNQVIERLGLSGIDAWVFWALQVFSAISTLIPIVFAIYEDTARMWRRSVSKQGRGDTPCPQ